MNDLHLHTNASFDAFTPPEMAVFIAHSNGLNAIAITDHRTIEGINFAIQAGTKLNLEVIPGVEVNTSYKHIHIHIVGLFIDHTNPSLLDFLRKLQKMDEIDHAINNQLYIGTLAGMGFPLTIEQIAHLVKRNEAWAGSFIKYLEGERMIDPTDEKVKQKIREKLMSVNYYRYNNRKIQADEVINHIRQANGLAILAHPLKYNMEWNEIDAMLATLKSWGLDGMEVYYNDYDEPQRNKLLALARKHKLFQSGGSDFHGYEKQDGRDIGKGLYGPLVPDEALDEMKNAHRKRCI
jgi:predicted metal-dependent phosphoesterase TrpH